MKKYEITFGALRLPLEFFVVFFAFFMARSIRLVTDLIPGVHLPIKTIATGELTNFAILGSILFSLIFIFSGLYKIKISNSKVKEFFDIARSFFIWFLFYVAILYLALGYLYTTEIPRLIIFFALIIAFFAIIFERFLLDLLIKKLIRSGAFSKNRIILIMKSENNEIILEFKKTFYYDVLGYINFSKIEDVNLAYLGDIKELKKLIKKGEIDEIILINSDYSSLDLEEIFEYSRIYGVKYKYLSNSFDLIKNNTEVSFLGKIPITEIKSIGLSPWGRIIKRIFDIIVSFISLIFLSPFFIIIGLLIKLEDPSGPAIYKNKRVGKNQSFFNLYKFRYMKREYCIKDSYGVDHSEDEALEYEKQLIKEKSTRTGPLYKIENDPRKTRIGAIIERFSIDELPQLFNVLVGNMSLVGPRPHQPREVKLYKEYQKRVLTIKPGITGMAQVNGRENNDFDDEVNLDIYYIENRSLLLDFKILVKTIMTVIFR
ncbi:exopolysaccharide biosynthesis polyprenyl glycosylphosphotransferase [Candidatus Gracilibacteria bacterium]|nr:exopolysaccharide biosynthesis polyprenyl glycosylphosphotransferase [Candidatus Gracilibacteria bacterium]